MVIYLDLLFLNNTIMTYAIVWAVGQLLDLPVEKLDILKAALLGSIITVVFLVFSNLNFSGLVEIFIYLIFSLFTAFLMVRTAFGSLSLQLRLRAVFYLFVITFIIIGIIIVAFNLLVDHISNYNRVPLYALTLGLVVLFILGKQGWLFFKTKFSTENLNLKVIIMVGQQEIKLKGFLDTGNRLHDPLSGYPVVIVELESVMFLFPEQLKRNIKRHSLHEIEKITEIINSSSYKNRFRILPFSDLGQKHGMLPGFIPDKLIVEYEDGKRVFSKIVLGLTERRLDEKGNFQALLPPDLINSQKYCKKN